MKLFWNSIATALQADAPLLALCGGDIKNIARANSPLAEANGVYFDDTDNLPLPGSDTAKIKTSMVALICVHEEIIVCADLARRVEQLWENADEKLAFLDITDNNILCNGSWLETSGSVRFDERLKRYRATVEVVYVWSYK